MCAIIKNPLQRDGTSQQQRMAKILLPENAKIDDRSIEEIIAFACEYIKLINYYNAANQTDPNTGWSCFYESDVCILLAIVAATDTESIEAAFKNLEEKITQLLEEKNEGELDETEAEDLTRYYYDVINLIYKVAERIQYTCTRLPNGHALKEEIITIIKNDLHLAIIDNKQQDALVKLIGYDKASTAPVNDYAFFIQTGNDNCECTKAWQLDQEGYDCIFPDTSFEPASLKALFYIFFIALLRIKQRAAYYFEDCIKNTDTHQPHITLFLTFLYLFRNATDHLNTLTRSHLLYYYETILCLHKKAATPDKVHIIFELAKNFDTHLVEEGTLLNAQKDDTGKQRVYALLEEVVVNKAKVEEVKTVYMVNGNNTSGPVKSASVANSKDGMGDAFGKEEQVHWRPLGGLDSPAKEIGFALASPMFFLSEGLRAGMVSYKLSTNPFVPPVSDPQIPLIIDNSFRLYYSSEKEWIEIENVYDVAERILVRYPVLSKLYHDNLSKIKEAVNKGFDAIKNLYDQLYPAETTTAVKTSVKAAKKTGDTLEINEILSFIQKADAATIAGFFLQKDDTEAAIKKTAKKTTAADEIDQAALVKEILQARNDVIAVKQVFVNNADSKRGELDFFFIANTTAASFTPLKTGEKNPDISAEWPLLKTVIKNEVRFDNKPLPWPWQYNAFQYLQIKGVDIKVAAYGMKNLVVQNDTSILDNSKETQPFTNRPYAGSYYYVGSKEVFQKKLDFAGAQLEWANLPNVKDGDKDEFTTYYNNYLTPVTNNSFRVNAEVLNAGNYQNIYLGDNQSLFGSTLTGKSTIVLGQIKKDDDNGGSTVPVDGGVIGLSNNVVRKDIPDLQQGFELRSFARDPYLPDFADYNVNVRRGFMRFQLTPQDFLHTEYPLSYTAQVVSKGESLVAADLPKEPYTPKLKNTSLFYVSSERTLFGAGQYNATIEHFYHVTPFGYQQMEIDTVSEVFLLPQFDYAADVADDIKFTQGNLYIGLKDAKPEQKVNILFQVLDGSGDNRCSPPDIEWDYLINNEWFPFQPFEIQDHTRADESSKKSLLKSGIIEFTLPKSISSKETTILNAGLLWIRACAHEEALPADPNLIQATQRIAALPDLVAVIAQAGIAQFEDQGNSLNHLAVPLPGKTISKFMDSRAAIKTVSQPYNSFDGRMPENDYQFYRRISERLRHKNRAICIWDYERLVLEQFPALYKVKCLNHTSILENNEIAPGFVSIAVIPDLRNRNTVNTTEPRVPIGLLDEIKVFLKKHTNLFVSLPFTTTLDYLQVVNPLYEQLKVTCCVRFYQGLDPAYYKYVLNSDLKNFLAPWAYNANSEISFGFAYHKSAILNFIEERKYVDVVLGFSVEHFKDGEPQISADADWIIPTTSRSILTTVSTADNSDYEHDISVASYTEDEPCKDCDDEGTATKVLPALKKVKQ